MLGFGTVLAASTIWERAVGVGTTSATIPSRTVAVLPTRPCPIDDVTRPGMRVCLVLTWPFKALVSPAVQGALQVVVGSETSVVGTNPPDWLTVVPEVAMTISVT